MKPSTFLLVIAVCALSMRVAVAYAAPHLSCRADGRDFGVSTTII